MPPLIEALFVSLSPLSVQSLKSKRRDAFKPARRIFISSITPESHPWCLSEDHTTESLDTRLPVWNTQDVDSSCVCVLQQISVTFMHHFNSMNMYSLWRLCVPAGLSNIRLDSQWRSRSHRSAKNSFVPVPKFGNVKKSAEKSVNRWKLQCEIYFSSEPH